MKHKSRLLFIVEAMGGGVFTYIVDLANQLVEDFEMYIAYAVRPQTPEDYKNYFDSRIHLIEVKNFSRDIGFIKELKALREIQDIAKKIRPDIIHLHSSKAGVLGRWAFNGHRIPMYYTPHGYSFLMSNYGIVKRTLFHVIEAVSAKRYCTTISCSAGEHHETLKLTKRAVYVNNGINCGKLDRLLEGVERNQNPFTVFTLGRICHQKNPALFNAVAESLPNIRFLWIGDGELRNELTSPNIEITGWLDRKAALKESMNADVFLLTSLWEGLPISLLEAMYMRKTAVVSDVIGNRDVIHSKKNGFVCREVSEFVEAIQAAQSGKCRELIDAAYTDVAQKYNTKVMAAKYVKIYMDGLQKKI